MSNTPWFHPFKFLTHLPFRVAEIDPNDESPYALLHENMHYIQSVATFSGIYRFAQFWWLYTQVAALRKDQGDRDFNASEREQIKQLYAQAHQDLLALEPAAGLRSAIIECETSPTEVIQYLNLPDDEKAHAYLRTFDGETQAVFYATAALQESMAHAYEIWLGKNDPDIYDVLAAADDVDMFQYVLGIESLKQLTTWTQPILIAGLTVVLCDFALNHPSPSTAFVRGASLVAAHYPTEPENLPIEEIIELLERNLIIPEILEEISKLNGYISTIKQKANISEDQFDQAVGAMLNVMLEATKIRLEQPAYFAHHMLTDFKDDAFLSMFHMPAYISGNEFIDTGIHPARHEFVLYIQAIYHRILNIVSEESDSRCPYLDSKVCGFDKTHECQNAPWQRRFDEEGDKNNSMVCVYRFAEHSLQSPA